MGNGTIMEVITCGMVANHPSTKMFFFVSIFSHYVFGSNASSILKKHLIGINPS